MKRSYHSGVFSNNTVRYSGNHNDITTRNKVTIKYSPGVKSNKIQYCKKCNTRYACKGIRYDMNSYGNNYKVKKNKFNSIITEELQAMDDTFDDYDE